LIGRKEDAKGKKPKEPIVVAGFDIPMRKRIWKDYCTYRNKYKMMRNVMMLLEWQTLHN
jgi:hypothetical protein